MNRHHHISQLIDRFFDGATTPDQERRIYAYFASHRDLGDLEQYRAMFGWYASLPCEDDQRRRVRRHRSRWAVAGVAAAVALVVGLGLSVFKPRAAVDSELYACYQGSYVVRDGERITDLAVIYPQIMRAEATADSINASIAEQEEDIERRLVEQAISGITDPALAAQVRRDILGDDM